MLITKGSPVLLHKEDREHVLRTLSRDTKFLAKHNIYGYALIVGIHNATPWDTFMLADMEAERFSRFGGHDPVEDR